MLFRSDHKDPGPPGQRGVNGANGATGGIGPAGPAIFMVGDSGDDGDIGAPGVKGATGAIGLTGPTGPAGTTLVYVNTTIPGGNTVANTSVETFFTSSYTVPANSLAIGTVLRIKLFGVYSTGVVAPSLILKVYFGATVLIASGTLTTVANITNDGWSAEGLFTVQGIGSSGTIEAQGLSEFSTASTVVLFVNMDNAAPVTVDTTINEAVRASVQWGGTVNASDTITLREMTVEVMTVAGIPVVPVTPPPFVFFGDDGEEGGVGPPGLQGPPGAGVAPVVGVPATLNDLVFWWDGATAIPATVSSGKPIPLLQNETPWYPSNSAIPGTATGGPLLSATPLNGRNVVTMGGSEHLSFAAGLLLKTITAFLVIKPASIASGDFLGGNGGCIGWGLNGGSNVYLSIDNVALIGTSTIPPAAGSWSQINVVYDGITTGAFAFRQAQAANGSGSSLNTPSSNNLSLLWNTVTGGTNYTGDVAEVIIYNRNLTLTEIQTVEAYLHTKWGV